METGKNETIDGLAGDLEARGIECRRERFRVPACPQISFSAGLALCAAGALLLVAGRPSSSFLAGIAGFVILLLCAYGFSPLDWLGPKEKRCALVVPGSPTEGPRKAVFLAIPLSCRLTGSGAFSRGEGVRRTFLFLGLLLSLVLPLLAGAETLHYHSLPRKAVTLAGTALGLFAAAEWVRGKAEPAARNLAAGWVDRWALPPGACPRPYLYVYPGDAAEVKFFLAKYRGQLFRGSGVFLEFPESASGPPAVSGKEGPFLPYRVDAGLLSRVRRAGDACGLPVSRLVALRFTSPGVVAMARGFRAVTLFRLEVPSGSGSPVSGESLIAWVAAISETPGKTDDLLTGDRRGV